MGGYVELTYGQVALAALLIVINGAISVSLNLRMERMLAIASIRTVVQLLLVGLVLEWVFRLERWYVVVGLASAMTLIAGITATHRNQRRYPGIWLNTILSVTVSAWLVTSFALFAVLQGIDRWYQPQYAIPLLGMVLGNTLNGISVGLNTFTESLVMQREHVESQLAMGATRWEAAREPVQHAIRTGMIPIINSMMVVGIVSLPGMMTGQLVTGMAPIQAVKYQIVIMFLIASATALGTVGVVVLSFLRLFNSEHQFLSRRISAAKKTDRG
jgi:putative ABC transport system permease protein